MLQASSSIGRVPVSKTGGWGFESLLACQAYPWGAYGMKWWEQVKSFLREVSSEIKKVTWPSRDETLATTVVVIAASFIFGVFLYLCDLAFFAAVRWIVKILS